MKSRKKKLKPSTKVSVNNRSAVHKYFPINEAHSLAIEGGRCYRCGKITIEFCFDCNKFVCKNHYNELKGEKYCLNCSKIIKSKPGIKSNPLGYIG